MWEHNTPAAIKKIELLINDKAMKRTVTEYYYPLPCSSNTLFKFWTAETIHKFSVWKFKVEIKMHGQILPH